MAASSHGRYAFTMSVTCLLYTSDAADERSSVDLGGRRIIKKKKRQDVDDEASAQTSNERTHTVRDNTQIVETG